jgi:uncharacterized protein YdcH (DUF465 family)
MLDETTKAKIEKAITESLPAQVGEVLRKQLERIPILEANNEKLEYKWEEACKQIKELNSENSKYREIISKHGQLDHREAEINKMERFFEVEQLKYQLQAEKEKTEFTKSVALGLVRNIEYRNNVMETKNVVAGIDQYGTPRTVFVADNKNDSRTAE